MERKRERALEGGVRSRERPLIGVRREAMERVRADLRLDALLPQAAQRLVAALELDDVCLPPVRVALVCARCLDDPELRRRMGEAGRERVRERFSWDAVTDATIAAYRDASGERA